MITERQGEILKTLIKEYIKTAEPVSSGFLASKYDFGLCSSAIRIEMQNLIQMGYLEQPHTSAGRIPTDKAYRFFVNEMVIKEEKEIRTKKIIEDIISKDIENSFRFASALSKILSEISSSFIFIHYPEKNLSWESGLDEIVKTPEFSDHVFVSDFLCLVDDFENKIVSLEPEKEIKIYIGEEVPLFKTANISIICARISSEDESIPEASIALVGPRRMNYVKNISLIKNLNKVLKDFYEERKR